MGNILYPVLKKYCTAALHFYFRKWQINGEANIPDGPVIFVPNHQNAFLDAVIVACSSRKNPWFMTRSDVFKNPSAKKMLHKLKMLPVYRFRDGYQTLKNNDAVISECISKINSGETLLIFAEGSHGEKYQLRPLQRGTARIAFAIDSSVNIPIIPVGLQYDFPKVFRSRVLVNFGKPIYVQQILKEQLEEREAHDVLMEKVKQSLQKLILHIDDEFYSEKFNYLQKHRIPSEHLYDQLINDQNTIEQFPQEHKNIFLKSKPGFFQKMVNLYTKINLWPASIVINKIMLKNVKDPQFGASIKFAAGMVITPFTWLIMGFIFFLITNSYIFTLLYVFTMVAALWFEKK